VHGHQLERGHRTQEALHLPRVVGPERPPGLQTTRHPAFFHRQSRTHRLAPRPPIRRPALDRAGHAEPVAVRHPPLAALLRVRVVGQVETQHVDPAGEEVLGHQLEVPARILLGQQVLERADQAVRQVVALFAREVLHRGGPQPHASRRDARGAHAALRVGEHRLRQVEAVHAPPALGERDHESARTARRLERTPRPSAPEVDLAVGLEAVLEERRLGVRALLEDRVVVRRGVVPVERLPGGHGSVSRESVSRGSVSRGSRRLRRASAART